MNEDDLSNCTKYALTQLFKLHLEYVRGGMRNIYAELALHGIKNECARTNTVFLPISEVCDGMVSLNRPGVVGAVLQSPLSLTD